MKKLVCILVFPVVVLLVFLVGALGDKRAGMLKKTLAGADRLVVSGVFPHTRPPFILEGAEGVAELVDLLEFDDLHSGDSCFCGGDSCITFYKGNEKLAALSHHHGMSLRWEGWSGDSEFTESAAKKWRIWFLKKGEPRFQEMHLARVERKRVEEGRDAFFLSAFPDTAVEVFERIEKTTKNGLTDVQVSDAQKLADLFHSRSDLGTALVKGLGNLCISGGGSWTVSSCREQLVLECARTLSGDEFLAILESSDDAVLAGAARLFFFEKHSDTLPLKKRNLLAAKLCGTVLKVDNSGNAGSALRALRRFPCQETTLLLEQLASGQIDVADQDVHPSPRTAACLFLAYTSSPIRLDCIQKAENLPLLDDFDRAALRVARALNGERGLLDSTIFELDSGSIAFAALNALEREGGRNAVDAVICGGLKHGWGSVNEKALSTAERMTGQRWKSKGWEREKEAHEWWKANRDSWPE